jgi:hypothetical protein
MAHSTAQQLGVNPQRETGLHDTHAIKLGLGCSSGYKQPDFCRHSFVYADGKHLHRRHCFRTKVAQTVLDEVSPDRSLRTMLKGRKMK